MVPQPAVRHLPRVKVALVLLAAALVGLVAGTGLPSRAATTTVSAQTFTICCRTGGGVDCVVDGDTAWIGGTKVQIR